MYSVVGDGRRAYLSYWDLGTVVLDVSDTSSPRYLGRSTGRDPVLLGCFELPGSVVSEGHRLRGLHPVSGLDLADSVHDAKLQGELAL